MPDAAGKEYMHEIDDRVSDAASDRFNADLAAGRVKYAKGTPHPRTYPSVADIVAPREPSTGESAPTPPASAPPPPPATDDGRRRIGKSAGHVTGRILTLLAPYDIS
jgi:hypothetical protein